MFLRRLLLRYLKAIEDFLQDKNDLKLAKSALEEFYISGSKTYTLEQIKKENGIK